MSSKSFLLELLKFGLAGIAGNGVSAILYYGWRGRLPTTFLIFLIYHWKYTVNIVEVTYYMITSIAGGFVHFLLSKFYVFVKHS